MYLNRAQCLAFWNLATVLPTDVQIEILTQEPAGHIIVRGTSVGWRDERSYRLKLHGGYEPLYEGQGEIGALEPPAPSPTPS